MSKRDVTNISRQTREEFSRLPLMLVKLAGGVMAVVGFGAAVWLATRSPKASPGNPLIPILVGAAGVIVFVLSDRKITVRQPVPETQPVSAGSKRMTVLASIDAGPAGFGVILSLLALLDVVTGNFGGTIKLSG